MKQQIKTVPCKVCGADGPLNYHNKQVYNGRNGKDLYVTECSECGAFYPVAISSFVMNTGVYTRLAEEWNRQNKKETRLKETGKSESREINTNQ